jgi:ubiquinone/menaquinone biosynthesis C-methylase UbiE
MTDFYSSLAKHYDQMYSFIDYAENAKKLHKIIQRYKKSSGNHLLDVACGTGTHILHLRVGTKQLGWILVERC